MTLKEMLEQRHSLFNTAHAIYKKAEGEKRDLTTEEKTNADKALTDADELKKKVEEAEKDETRANRMKELESEMNTRRGRRSEPANPGEERKKNEVRSLEWDDGYGRKRRIDIRSNDKTSNEQYERRYNNYLYSGIPQGLASAELPNNSEWSDDEARALQADLPAAGGYVLAPPMFVAQLIQAVDNETFLRRIATVLPPGNGIGAPSLDADPADPTWTAELDIGAFDSTMVFGKRELKPHVLAQGLKVSKSLLRLDSVISVDSVVRERLAYKQGVVMETAYLSGAGGYQPLGVFTASAQGISTGRDVSTDNTTTSMTADGLKNAKWTLKPQYYQKAQWIFHRDGIKQIDKLKDGNGKYLLDSGDLRLSSGPGVPDRLYGLPMNLSEYAPNTFTTGLYVGILGDFSKYWIQDSLNMTIQVLMELYAGTNQNGYLSRFESDGMPVIEEAFVRVKLA